MLNLAHKQAFSSTYLAGVVVAWQPDGHVLAVDGNTPQHGVRLIACATGKTITTLIPLAKGGVAGQEAGEANVLRWSPDGARLLLFDTQLGTVTIWPTGRGD